MIGSVAERGVDSWKLPLSGQCGWGCERKAIGRTARKQFKRASWIQSYPWFGSWIFMNTSSLLEAGMTGLLCHMVLSWLLIASYDLFLQVLSHRDIQQFGKQIVLIIGREYKDNTRNGHFKFKCWHILARCCGWPYVQSAHTYFRNEGGGGLWLSHFQYGLHRWENPYAAPSAV